ncbi:MAG: cupredoxin domain-containing protein [Candidatus Limnocylindria bacterium]
MPNRAVTAFLAAILALALAACAGATSAPSSAEASEPSVAPASSEAAQPSEEPSEEPSASEDSGSEERVRIDNSNFDPAELTIAVGTEVTWVNADTFGHTVTEGTDGQAVDDPVVDEEIDQGGAVSVVFDEPGTYEITCRIHPSMNMTITVEG